MSASGDQVDFDQVVELIQTALRELAGPSARYPEALYRRSAQQLEAAAAMLRDLAAR